MEHWPVVLCCILLLSNGYFLYVFTNSVLFATFCIFCTLFLLNNHNPEPSNNPGPNNGPSELLKNVLGTYTIMLLGSSAFAVGHLMYSLGNSMFAALLASVLQFLALWKSFDHYKRTIDGNSVHDSVQLKAFAWNRIHTIAGLDLQVFEEKDKLYTVFEEKDKHDTVFEEKDKLDTVFEEKDKHDTELVALYKNHAENIYRISAYICTETLKYFQRLVSFKKHESKDL